MSTFKKLFIEQNPLSLPQKWQEGDGSKWDRTAVIKIFETKKDFLKGKQSIHFN